MELIEIKSKRNHYEKHFDKGNGEFVCHKFLGLAHYFDGVEYKDIKHIPFPEGKEINTEEDLEMIDIPEWGAIELKDNGNKAVLKDKAGVEIQEFNQAFFTGKKVSDPYELDGKDKLGFDKKKLKEDSIIRTKFKINGNKLAFELPIGVEAKKLKAYDDTTSTITTVNSSIQSSSADTNYYNAYSAGDGGTYYTILQEQNGAGNYSRNVFGVTLPSGTGTISKVTLNGFVWNVSAGDPMTLNVHEITQAGMTLTGVTWNNYAAASAWSTAGGDFSSTVIDDVYWDGSDNTWLQWVLMGTGSTNPLTLDWEDQLDVIVKSANESTASGAHAVYLVSQQNSGGDHGTAARPYFEITYSAAGYTGTGTITLTPTNTKKIIKSIGTTLTLTPTKTKKTFLTKAVEIFLSSYSGASYVANAAIALAASVLKFVKKEIDVTITLTPTISFARVFCRIFNTTVGLTATKTKAIFKTLSTALTLVATSITSSVRSLVIGVTLTLTASNTISKLFRRTFEVTISLTSQILRIINPVYIVPKVIGFITNKKPKIL